MHYNSSKQLSKLLSKKGEIATLQGEAPLRHTQTLPLIVPRRSLRCNGHTTKISLLYWKGIKKFIRKFIRHCVVCQRNKYDITTYPGLLHPLPISQVVCTDISMDLLPDYRNPTERK